MIKEVRERQGLTLEELADRAGCHRTSISLVERGLRSLTVRTAAQLADAFGIRTSHLVALGEGRLVGDTKRILLRPSLNQYLTNSTTTLDKATGLDGKWVADGVLSAYETLDLIDGQLLARGVDPLSETVELANLSSMLGNLLCAGLANASDGRYVRNRPHAYPDLLATSSELSGIEVKTALETNKPKGHLPKSGFYMTFRYVLGDRYGGFTIGKEHRGDTIWIWECRVGKLTVSDFDLSNTPGDSGKTAIIKTESFKRTQRVLYVPELLPYKRRSGWYGDDPEPPANTVRVSG